jgi:diketogulonate reductase-like aldo/keto reductase
MTVIPTIKSSTGMSIPKLGFGTWLIGGTKERDPQNDDAAHIKAIQNAVDAGITWFRTAQNYAEGHCEELLGEAIKPYKREDLFMNSCVNQNFAIDKKTLIEHAEASLKRLQIDYFDLYMIGAVNPNYDVSGIMDGLLYLLEKGITKNIGVANYRMEELQFAWDYTDHKIAYNEMHYNLIIREPEITGELEFCRENGIVFGAYRPVQLGQLSKPGIKILDEMAEKYGKTQAQIALKWLVEKDDVVTMPKTLNEKHLQENLAIFDFSMDTNDLEKLSSDFPIKIAMSDCTPPLKYKKIQ